MARKERGQFELYMVQFKLHVHGRLFASGPSGKTGVDRTVANSKPTDREFAARQETGEVLKSLPELGEEMLGSAELAAEQSAEEGFTPSSAVFRRQKNGQPFLHSNYLKGHLRESCDTLSRQLGVYGFEKLATRTVMVTPEKQLLRPEQVGQYFDYFAPTTRTKGGIELRQGTEKVMEFVQDPTLKYTLFIVPDPRWDIDLLDQILAWGSMRGIGPGRALDTSKYTYDLSAAFTILPYADGTRQYHDLFYTPREPAVADLSEEERVAGPWIE